jgi:hypothetical protein
LAADVGFQAAASCARLADDVAPLAAGDDGRLAVIRFQQFVEPSP